MKILLIQPTGDKRGHYGIYTVNVCQGLAQLGHEVTLFTSRVHPELFLSEKPCFEIIEYGNGKYNFDKYDQAKSNNAWAYSWGYIRNCFVILKAGLKFAQRKDFDVVQIFDTEYGIGSLLMKIYGKNLPLVLMVNAPNFGYSEYIGPYLVKLYKTFQGKLLKSLLGKQIRGVNMLGEFHRTEFRRQFHLPESFPIAVIYDGADAPKVVKSKETARKDLGVTYQGPLFLLFGMMRRDKGVKDLLDAVVLMQDLDFKLFLVGSMFDYTEEELMKMIKDRNIEEKVIARLGYIDDKDIYDYFFASDALVLPYVKLYRGGSGPLLKEAAICKVPAIVSDVSEMGPLVKKNQMGFTVESENPVSLADGLKKFLKSSDQERHVMGENAFRAANTWSTMAKEYESFYHKIINL